MVNLTWTWDINEPSIGGECVVQKEWGWAAVSSEEANSLPLACRAIKDETIGLQKKLLVGEGYVAVPPTNNYANKKLRDSVSADGLGGGHVRLMVGLDGKF